MKKIINVSIVCLVFLITFSFAFAKTKLAYERAENLALQYIENSLEDESWKNNNPKISWEWKYFYTDDEKKPSYVEFKISCDKNPDCWFILVNTDWNDVAVPISSTNWNTPSEVIKQEWEQKNYYFWPLDIYSENIDNWDVQTIVIPEQIDLRKNDENNKSRKQKLKQYLKDRKINAKEFKKSDEFKKQKEEIKDQILKMPKEEFSFKSLNMAFADENPDTTSTYISPWSSDKYVSWNSTSDCNSRTPCYKQFTTSYTPPPSWYTSAICYSWCSPTAVAILFWYYDRNWFSDLVSWTAPTSPTMNTTSKNLVNSIKTHIWTTCIRKWNTNEYAGSTNPLNVYKAKQYAIDKWYKNTISSYISWNTSTLFSTIKIEIDANRPIITHMKKTSDNSEWHATVTYWYKSSPSNSNIVLMNMGWWNNLVNGTSTRFSSINQHISAVSYGWPNDKTVYAVTKFTIKK